MPLIQHSPEMTLACLHDKFLGILPKIERHARFAFRHLQQFHDREDAIQETIAISWAWYRRLAEQGRDATRFPTVLAMFAARHVKAGRRLCGTENSKDPLSPTAKRRRGIQLHQLVDHGASDDPAWQAALIDRRPAPVPEAAAFRLDFRRWLKRLPPRYRHVTMHMIAGERTLDLAQRFRLSPARISQLRRNFNQSWREFVGDCAHDGERPGTTTSPFPVRGDGCG